MHHSVHHKLLILQFNFTNVVAFIFFFLVSPFSPFRTKCVNSMLGKLIKFRYKWHRRIYISEARQLCQSAFRIHIWCAHSTETTSTAAAAVTTTGTRLTLAINLFKRLRINHLKVKYTSEHKRSVLRMWHTVVQLSRTSPSSYTHYSLNMHLPSDKQ